MSDLFLEIVRMSFSASWLILAVLVLRVLLKKAPKWIHVMFWGVVAVRLILPGSIERSFSLIPSVESTGVGMVMNYVSSIQRGNFVGSNISHPFAGVGYHEVAGSTLTQSSFVLPFLSIIWGIGVALLLFCTVISYWRLQSKVKEAVRLRDNIFQSENVSSPFVFGIIRPRIYLPYYMDALDQTYAVAHEQAHIRRKDYVWKFVGFILLAIHWFNPLMWLSYTLLCKDIEFACDEKVIKELGCEERADYVQTLVNCSVNRCFVTVCPLAFGEVSVKQRVKSVMNYKKPALWIMIISISVCGFLAVCFLTSPVARVKNPWVKEYVPGATGIQGNVDVEKYERVSEDFAIGADQYGRAVFKDPQKAFGTVKKLYADAIKQIQKEYHLPPLSTRTYQMYKTYGWQTTSYSSSCRFVSSFLDIYENSFISY